MRKILWALSLILILSACQAESALPTSTPTPPPTATKIPTNTPLPPTATPTETPLPTPTEIPVITFAVIGDYGTAGADLAAIAEMIDSWDVDFIITVGDNNHPAGSPKTIDENIGQYFHSYIYPYAGEYGEGAETNRFFPTLGNHDWMWNQAQPYLDYFELPGNERYYEFEWDFLHFFALSSDWAEPDGIGKTQGQAEWFYERIDASSAPWQIVYFHHAPYSSGYHGPTVHMQWPFKEHGADVVFSGHDHHYERLMVDELPYFIVGVSGGGFYDIPTIYPGSQTRVRKQFGAMRVTATPFELHFEFFNIDGELLDEYSVYSSQ